MKGLGSILGRLPAQRGYYGRCCWSSKFLCVVQCYQAFTSHFRGFRI